MCTTFFFKNDTYTEFFIIYTIITFFHLISTKKNTEANIQMHLVESQLDGVWGRAVDGGRWRWRAVPATYTTTHHPHVRPSMRSGDRFGLHANVNRKKHLKIIIILLLVE